MLEMLDGMTQLTEFLFYFAGLVVVVMLLILLVLFLGYVPKYLKGMMEALERRNDLLEKQERNKAMNDLVKSVVKDMVKEIKEEEKKKGA